MSTRIELIRGTTRVIEVDLVDENNAPLTSDALEGATAQFTMRLTAEGADVLSYAAEIVRAESYLKVTIPAADTEPLDLGAYLYKVDTTLADGTVMPTIEWAPLDLVLGGSATEAPPVFDNTVKVDHDYQLAGDLAYKSPGGSPIDNAQVRIYYKSDYDAGLLGSPVGVTQTDAKGNWKQPVLVLPGFSYIVQFFKPNEFGPDVKEIVA